MALQHRQLELDQPGWIGAAGRLGIHAMKCASVSLAYNSSSRVPCAVADGKVSEASTASSSSSSSNYRVVDGAVGPGPAGLSGLSAARQRVPWPRP